MTVLDQNHPKTDLSAHFISSKFADVKAKDTKRLAIKIKFFMTIFSKNIFMILAVSMLLTSCGQKKQTENTTTDAVKVTAQEITVSSKQQELAYSGSIEADNTVSIGFGVAGRVLQVYVQEGQRVSKGHLLASVEQDTYQSSYQVASAGLEQAQDNFNRLDQLYKKGSLPERDFIAAKVGLAQAKANREIAAKNLRDTKLYASFSGIIAKKITEAGAAASPAVPAFTIVKTDKVYATAAITESEISSLKIGAATSVTIPSLNKNFNGKIAIINPQADNSSKTYMVKVRLDNPNAELLPGMIADLIIKTGGNKNSIIIPASAVVRDADNINYVFLVKANNTAFKKRINISGITGASDVVVNDGLNAGDKLIVSGQTSLEDGTAVKL